MGTPTSSRGRSGKETVSSGVNFTLLILRNLQRSEKRDRCVGPLPDWCVNLDILKLRAFRSADRPYLHLIATNHDEKEVGYGRPRYRVCSRKTAGTGFAVPQLTGSSSDEVVR